MTYQFPLKTVGFFFTLGMLTVACSHSTPNVVKDYAGQNSMPPETKAASALTQTSQYLKITDELMRMGRTVPLSLARPSFAYTAGCISYQPSPNASNGSVVLSADYNCTYKEARGVGPSNVLQNIISGRELFIRFSDHISAYSNDLHVVSTWSAGAEPGGVYQQTRNAAVYSPTSNSGQDIEVKVTSETSQRPYDQNQLVTYEHWVTSSSGVWNYSPGSIEFQAKGQVTLIYHPAATVPIVPDVNLVVTATNDVTFVGDTCAHPVGQFSWTATTGTGKDIKTTSGTFQTTATGIVTTDGTTTPWPSNCLEQTATALQ